MSYTSAMQAAAARAAAKAALSAKARARQKRMEATEKLERSHKRYMLLTCPTPLDFSSIWYSSSQLKVKTESLQGLTE